MKDLLIVYSTTDGHAKKIAEFLSNQLNTGDFNISIVNVEQIKEIKIKSFQKLLVVASIRYGKFNKSLRKFISENGYDLNEIKTAFVSINLIARKPEKSSPDTNVYTRRFLNKSIWKPDLICVVAGMLDYPRYGFWDRQMIRLIMKITGGPTDPDLITEFTDWDKLKKFADMISQV